MGRWDVRGPTELWVGREGRTLSAEELLSTEINVLPGWWRDPRAGTVPPTSTGTEGTEGTGAPAHAQPSSPPGRPSVRYQVFHSQGANVPPRPVIALTQPRSPTRGLPLTAGRSEAQAAAGAWRRKRGGLVGLSLCPWGPTLPPVDRVGTEPDL